MRLIEINIASEVGSKFHYSMGSIMHGALMELLPEAVAEELHVESLRPFSQHLIMKAQGEEAVWRIGLLDDYFGSIIFDTLQEKCQYSPSIFLKQKNAEIKLLSMQTIAETSFAEITDTVYQSDSAPIGAEIKFNTVTSFKHDGKYAIYPELSMLFGSLINKWNMCSPDIKLHEEHLGEHLAVVANVSDYRLRTMLYSLEGIRIKGFCGNVSLRFFGNEMARRLIGILLQFAPYCGIGIKTALGMGGVETELRFRKN